MVRKAPTGSWLAYLDKDDRLADGHETIELAKYIVLGIVVGTVNEHLRNTLDRELATLELQRVRVRRELHRILVDLFGESGGEKKDLDVLRKQTGDVSSRRPANETKGLTTWCACTGRRDPADPTCYQPHPRPRPSTG